MASERSGPQSAGAVEALVVVAVPGTVRIAEISDVGEGATVISVVDPSTFPGDRKAYAVDKRPRAFGGYAEIFEATVKATGERVAFKRLRDTMPESTGRFRREIRIQCELDGHPHVMQVLDVDPGGRWCWGFNEERYEDMHRFAVTQRGLFRQMSAIDGAAPALRRLSDANVHIRIVTHRLFIPYFHQEAVRQTVEWLDHWGIPYRDLCLAGDKVAVGADLYIEDSPRNVEALRTVCPTIVYTNSTNRHLGGLRADNWKEAEEIVLRLQSEWKGTTATDGKEVSGN